MHYLREEDFLKESRYAELFVRGKVNNNKWGPRKIEVALKSKKVDPTLIRHELEKFDAEWPELKAYWSARMTKAWAHKSYDDFTLKGKLRAFLRQKGFCLAPTVYCCFYVAWRHALFFCEGFFVRLRLNQYRVDWLGR